MKKRNVLTIRVPADLKHHIEKTAALQGVSINQLAVAISGKTDAEATETTAKKSGWRNLWPARA